MLKGFSFFLLFFSLISEGKTFIYCSEASPKTFNPQLALDGPTFNASSKTIYDRLLSFEHGGTQIVPGLAKSWNISKNGKAVTLHLRKGVSFQKTPYFSPTRTFQADDVVFTFERMLKKNHPYHKIGGGLYKYFYAMNMHKILSRVEKIDKYKVRFHLSRREAPFLSYLAMDFSSILSEEYGSFLLKKKKPSEMDRRPIGTGPFLLKNYKKDTSIYFVSHKKYFLGKPKIERLIFQIVPESHVRVQKLKTKECHLIAGVLPQHVDEIKKNKKTKLVQGLGLNVSYLAFNVEKAPFKDLNVRKAIYHALNRNVYKDVIYLGGASIAKTPLPPGMPSHNSRIKDYSYNVNKAKSYLKKAGYPKGFKTTLWVLPVYRPYNPDGKKMGELMQSDLKKVGIQAKLVTYKWGEYLSRAGKGEHDMIQLGWISDNGDPDNFLSPLLSCAGVKAQSNYSRWCFPPFEKWILKGKKTNRQSLRRNYYRKAQAIFHKEIPWTPLFHSNVYRAHLKKVKNYKISPFGTESFFELDLN